MNIYINVVNQKLTPLSTLRNFVEGSQKFVYLSFNLDEAWDGLTVFAQFKQNGTAYNQYLDANNSVYLPREIKAGTCTLMLYGTGSTVIGTTNYLTLSINESNYVSNAQSTDITQSLYQQLVARVVYVQDELALKVNKPTTNPNGTNGQVLRTKGNGETEWITQGLPTDAQTATAINAWLDAHPEATTTVEDGSITKAKLNSNALPSVSGSTLYL